MLSNPIQSAKSIIWKSGYGKTDEITQFLQQISVDIIKVEEVEKTAKDCKETYHPKMMDRLWILTWPIIRHLWDNRGNQDTD